jgi:hypothetical protein
MCFVSADLDVALLTVYRIIAKLILLYYNTTTTTNTNTSNTTTTL